MTYDEALAFIHSRKRFGSTLGLERVETMLALMGHPEEKVKCIHVAGTNGKGSTSAMFAEVFSRAGYKTGLYISPFVEDFRERIQIDREMIPKEKLACWVEKLIPLSEETEKITGTPVTEFEFETAMAFGYYAEENCDVAVMEVGMGGRFDATNVIKEPLLSAICYIGLDHTQILGDTYAKIAFEKCGIIKKGCPTVSYASQRDEALEVIKTQAAEKESTLLLPEKKALEILSLTADGSRFLYKGEEYFLAIPAEHIVYNSLSFIEVTKYLAKDFPGLDASLKEALREVRFGGRFEKIGDDFYIDAAHNPDCVDAVTKMLDTLFDGKRLVVIMGMLADKDHTYCIHEVARRAASFYAVTPDSPRAQSAEVTAKEASEVTGSTHVCASVREAVEMALADQKNNPGSVILSLGSLYYIGSVKKEYLDIKAGN